jgi:antitoxin CptB
MPMPDRMERHMTADLEPRKRRAAYRAAHRGTKEMDILLGRFSDARLAAMSAQELAEFEALLASPDPELQRWIMDGNSVPDDRVAGLVGELRAFHQLVA